MKKGKTAVRLKDGLACRKKISTIVLIEFNNSLNSGNNRPFWTRASVFTHMYNTPTIKVEKGRVFVVGYFDEGLKQKILKTTGSLNQWDNTQELSTLP